MTEFDLRLANYVQDKGRIDFETCESLFGKSRSSMKRSIYTLNEYLPESLHFSISNHEMKTHMTYADFSNLCARLTLEDYSTSVDERLMLVVCYAFFRGIVNMTQVYTELNLSVSTKKNDRKELGSMLEGKGVRIVNRHRRGIELLGNERFQRMYVARKLISVIELNEHDAFVPRKANTPVQKLLYEVFEEHLAEYHEEVKAELEKFFRQSAASVDYASKKFLYIHYAISIMRINKGHQIKTALKDMPEVPRYNLLPVKKDSQYLDYLIASLNYKEPIEFPTNETIKEMTHCLIKWIEENMDFQIFTLENFFNEMYAYLYKCQIKNKLDYFFYDDKLDNTKKEFPGLFRVIQKGTDLLADRYDFRLTEHQVSVICLMAETYLMQNRLVRKNNPKILIITNSSVEKVKFFLEALSQHVGYEMVSYLTINELYKLNQLDFDAILTFSNRITVLLNELGWESIKLNFYLTTEDIKKLLDNGFTSNRNRKVLAEEVVDELLEKHTKEEMIRHLRERFPDFVL